MNPKHAISHGFPSVHPLVASVSLLPTELPPSYFPRFPSVHLLVASVSFLPNGALPKLFRMVSLPSTLSSLPYRSFPSALSRSYFPRFPPRPHSCAFRIAPSHRRSPKLYFPLLPFRPTCRHSRYIAPSHRSSPHAISHGFSPSTLSSLPYRSFRPNSPQAISHGFPSVHPVVIHVSLLPLGALPKLFPTFSRPSTLSLLPYRCFPSDLSPSYFPRFPFRPPSRRFRIAPSQRSSPQAISHNFPSVHPLVASVSLLPNGSPQAISHGFPSVHLVVASMSLLPTELPPSYFPRFPVRPPSRCFRIVPSQRSSPQAISHGFPSLHPLAASVSLLPFGALTMLFPTVSPPSTLSLLPYRSLFPFRPPSRRFHGFPSVHPVVTPVSLLSTGALPMLFPTVSFPSTLSSLPYRSFPTGSGLIFSDFEVRARPHLELHSAIPWTT